MTVDQLEREVLPRVVEEGYEAGRRGAPANDCPYQRQSEHLRWRKWQLGRAVGLVESAMPGVP